MNRPTETDSHLMQHALELARRAKGRTRPNPMVGAVISREGRIIAEGFHSRAGQPHAEREALAACTEDLCGATMHVTLEPCAHTGRTPPCTEAILEAGIGRVVIAATDPNPKARGGAEILRAAGVEVLSGVLAEEARLLNPAFHTFHALGRPLVTLKWAMSADGCTSAANAESKWITGTESRARAHQLRAEHDATLAGIETVLQDAARLSVRDAPVPPGPPLLRVVLDSALRLPVDHPFVRETEGMAVVITSTDADKERERVLHNAGVKVWRVTRSSTGRGLDPQAVLQLLAKEGVQSILIEGGRRVAGAFADAGMIDRVALFVAPIVIGSGGKALSALLSGDSKRTMADTIRLARAQWEQIGSDALLTGWVSKHLLDDRDIAATENGVNENE